jgi:hypothetical protein
MDRRQIIVSSTSFDLAKAIVIWSSLQRTLNEPILNEETALVQFLAQTG